MATERQPERVATGRSCRLCLREGHMRAIGYSLIFNRREMETGGLKINKKMRHQNLHTHTVEAGRHREWGERGFSFFRSTLINQSPRRAARHHQTKAQEKVEVHGRSGFHVSGKSAKRHAMIQSRCPIKTEPIICRLHTKGRIYNSIEQREKIGSCDIDLWQRSRLKINAIQKVEFFFKNSTTSRIQFRR